MRFFRLVRHRVTIVAAVAAAAVGGVVVVGLNQGNDTQDVRLLSGEAWFASAKVGQVTLLDGASAEVAAQVKVASAGDMLSVVQQGATAYTVDQSDGTIRRVDGATFDLTPPAAPIADARGTGLNVVAGPDSLYTLDSTRGILASTDPKTLNRRGDMVSVASKLAAGTVAVDDAGTLWAVNTATGDVNRVRGPERTIRSAVVKPGDSTITIAHGHPVVVDMADGTATSIDRANGRPGATFPLGLLPDEKVQVSGSPNAERIYVVAARGVLDVCDVAAGHCDSAIPLTAGSEYGPAVEAGNRVFVPDYTTGQVLIVSLQDQRVIARPNVLKPNVRFQLLTHDGLVFYNDTNSEQAGVLKVDGSVNTIRKYDPASPEKGVVQPNGDPQAPKAGGTQPPQPTGTQQRNPNSQQPNPGTSIPSNQPNQPSSPSQSTPTGQPDPSAPAPTITVSKATPVVDEPIELKVTDGSGVAPVKVHWTYGDGTEEDGTAVVHKWAAARPTPYIVSVVETMPSGQTGSKSVNVTVSDKPKNRLQVNVSAGGSVSSSDNKISACTSSCFFDYDPGVVITLTATPDGTHRAGNWTGCSSADTTCDVTMDAAKTVGYQFQANKVTYTLTMPAGGVIAVGGVKCPPTCGDYQVDFGTNVKFAATASSGNSFGGWTSGGCPNPATSSCMATASANQTVAASFTPIPTTWTLTVHVKGSVEMFDPNVKGPNGLNCGYNSGENICSVQVQKNQPVTLSAGSNSGDTSVNSWTDPCTRWSGGQPSTCSFTMTGDVDTTATFMDN